MGCSGHKHTQCLQMMLKPLILNYSSMFKVESINKNHLKNRPEKCHEQLTKINMSIISGSRNVKPILNQQPCFLEKASSVQHKIKSLNINIFIVRKYYYLYKFAGDCGSTVVKVLCYKSEGRWFDPSLCQWIFH